MNQQQFFVAVFKQADERINARYQLNDGAADLLFEHMSNEDVAHTTPDEVRGAIYDLMLAKMVNEMAYMSYQLNHDMAEPTNLTIAAGFDEIYTCTKTMILDGQYKSWDHAVEQLADMMLSYNCYEPWDRIAQVAGDMTDDPAKFAQLVPYIINYLYDGYTISDEDLV